MPFRSGSQEPAGLADLRPTLSRARTACAGPAEERAGVQPWLKRRSRAGCWTPAGSAGAGSGGLDERAGVRQGVWSMLGPRLHPVGRGTEVPAAA